MSEFAFFIDERYLKKNTPIDDNVNANLLKTAMRNCQEIHIRDIIGSGIYDAICDEINATGPLTDTSIYFELVNEFIAPCLAYYIVYDSAETISFQILNKGVQTRDSANSKPASIDEIVNLAGKWKMKAEYYGTRLYKHLCEHATDYPLFHNPGSGTDTIHPHSDHLFGGMDLG